MLRVNDFVVHVALISKLVEKGLENKGFWNQTKTFFVLIFEASKNMLSSNELGSDGQEKEKGDY